MLCTSNSSRDMVLMNSISSAESEPQQVAILTNVVNKKTVSDVRFLIMRSTNCSRIAVSIIANQIITFPEIFNYLSLKLKWQQSAAKHVSTFYNIKHLQNFEIVEKYCNDCCRDSHIYYCIRINFQGM